MIRYLKQYKFLLFLTVLFTAISSLSYVFIAILRLWEYLCTYNLCSAKNLSARL